MNWTDEIENILKKLRLNSILLSKHHSTEYFKLCNLLKYFRIPVIVLSGFSSILDVILKDYIEVQTASIICCGISLCVGMIGSIELYLSIDKNKEIALHSSKAYSNIASNINKMLSLAREQRPNDGLNYLEEMCNEYNKIGDNSVVTDEMLNSKILELNIISQLTEQDEIKISKNIKWISKYQNMLLNVKDVANNILPPISSKSSLTLTPRIDESYSPEQSIYNSPQQNRRKNSFIIDTQKRNDFV